MGFESIRENELPFFKNNQIATPARVTSFQNVGGKQQPTVSKDFMRDTGMGKQVDQRDPELEVYVDNPYNLS